MTGTVTVWRFLTSLDMTAPKSGIPTIKYAATNSIWPSVAAPGACSPPVESAKKAK
jgi:hypothetical protein